jgi:hypothetical protein
MIMMVELCTILLLKLSSRMMSRADHDERNIYDFKLLKNHADGSKYEWFTIKTAQMNR